MSANPDSVVGQGEFHDSVPKTNANANEGVGPPLALERPSLPPSPPSHSIASTFLSFPPSPLPSFSVVSPSPQTFDLTSQADTDFFASHRSTTSLRRVPREHQNLPLRSSILVRRRRIRCSILTQPQKPPDDLIQRVRKKHGRLPRTL